MTAEIAILNRTAVALAADSAATLTGPGGSKTFDSAEKIFELCCNQPIALMLFNNAQFMGVPFDVLARGYRRDRSDKARFNRLTDVWPDFRTFLEEFPRGVEDEEAHLTQHAYAIFKRVSEGSFKLRMEAMTKALAKRSRQFPPQATDPAAYVIGLAKAIQADHEKDPNPGYLHGKTLADFEAAYGDRLDSVAATAFKANLDDAVLAALRELMFAVVKSRRKSSGFTGVVFAGYGDDDIFPTLQSVELDGIYLGEPRVLNQEIVDIDRRQETAAVIPFAQKDMPQRFIYGLDDGLQRHVERLVSGVVEEIVTAKPRVYKAGLGEAIKSAARARVNDALEEFKTNSERKLKNVVNFMSKRELAEVAQSLVELTSRKRRFSDDQETVGGPIDVAVLSKSEGFIWIQRKHYFDAELNPSFFVRNGIDRRP